jgi:arsenite methyltransferase
LELRALIGDELRPGGLALTERALTLCRFPEKARIWDVGCGWGGTVRYLRGLYGYRAAGVDFSAETLLEDRRLPAVCATALALPVRSEILDGIFCECVLSLLPSAEETLVEFHRILKPGGRLVLTDIYLRKPGERPAVKASPLFSCLEGAVGIDRRITQVETSGLEVLMWEDHSRLLAELAARIVWNNGSLSSFFESLVPLSCSPGERFDTRCTRPGYYLLIARKNEKETHGRPQS